MASRMIRAGERGIDSSFSHPPVARLVELGNTFRVGYLSVAPASPGKNITIAECVETIDAGMGLLLVFEMSATRATLGASYGTADGANARALAHARGQPVDVPILIADDTATTALNLPLKVAYMHAAAAAAKPYDIGIYGGVKILAALVGLWRIGWVPITAWSWSVNLTRLSKETLAAYNARGRAAASVAAREIGAHCLQDNGFYIDNTWAVDTNIAIADFPVWGNPRSDQQENTDMPAFISNKVAGKYGAAPSPEGGCTIWEMVRNQKSALSLEAWLAYGQPFGIACDDSVLDGIPDYTPDTAGSVGATGPQGEPGPTGATGEPGADASGVDDVARKGVADLHASIADVGQSLGDTQAALRQAGGA